MSIYAQYWNLKATPFLNVIDRRLLFPGEQHEEAIARFTFLAESGRLAGILTGPYGVGKSTVLNNVISAVESQTRIPTIRMDAIPGGQLPMAQQILAAMNIKGPSATLPDALMNFWKAAEQEPESLRRTLLCIDEAHYLAQEHGLYLVHYLTNIRIRNRKEQTEEPLFTVIMAGSPALKDAIVQEPSLAQRVQIVFELPPFSRDQTCAYIQHHMRAVGGDIWSFDREAMELIHEISGGLPRKINLICDTSLMLGFAAQASRVTPAIVSQSAMDTGQRMPASFAQPQPETLS